MSAQEFLQLSQKKKNVMVRYVCVIMYWVRSAIKNLKKEMLKLVRRSQDSAECNV